MNSSTILISERHRGASCPRKRILVVNCYFDDSRLPIPRTNKLPRPMGPAYLAGAFSRELCEVRLHCEMYSGPLEDPQLLAWPDMLVLTGLTTGFDRMLHLTAYARTKKKDVIVVAGGSPIRAFPRYARRFFDYCCLGDIEQMRDVIADAFGEAYVAEEMLPRYDLAYWIGKIGHAESSRYCNFRCSFCTITAEGRGYQRYDLDYIRRQLLAMGKKELVLFIDNNFYGNNRNYFLARLDLIREMYRAGHLGGWAALVTNDFFFKDENLKLAREAGCLGLFSGVESFDTDWLRKMNKIQNTRLPQVELIRKCLDAGIVFFYGLMVDVSARPVAALRRELEFITGTPDITLPGYISIPIPLPGTPFFYDCLAEGRIFPLTKVRDLDSTTLSLEPLDSTDEVLEFLRDIQSLRGYRRRVIQHALGFVRKYRRVLTKQQLTAALANGALLCAYRLMTSPSCGVSLRRSTRLRSHVSTTDSLDPVYQPAFRVASRYEDYFKPTMITDKFGALTEELAEDLGPSREARVETLVTL